MTLVRIFSAYSSRQSRARVFLSLMAESRGKSWSTSIPKPFTQGACHRAMSLTRSICRTCFCHQVRPKIAAREYLVQLNGSPDVVSQFNNLPIKTANGSIIYLRDVAQVHDGYAVQTNIVRENGVRAALVAVLRSAGASTVDIVNRVKARLVHLEPSSPPGLHVEPLFDQSVFVKAAIWGVIKETMIAGCLTALVILLFLGSWRSTLIIVVSIPLAMLSSINVLKAPRNP